MPEISIPKVTPDIDGLHLDWLAENIRCDVTAIYQHHNGDVACELHITTSAEGFNPHLLRHHVADLANASSRDRLASLLKRSYNHVEWPDITEDICEYTLAHLRRPPTATSTIDFMEAKPPEFILWPFLLRHENNMIFAPGGGGKSNLALLWLILLESAMTDNPFNWIVRRHPPIVCLFLDWERSFATHAHRMRGLLGGLELPTACPDTPFNYYRLHAPLWQEIRNVQHLINQHQASFLISDSCGMAAGGDMNKSEPAIQFFAALGALRAYDGQPLTNLLISHTSKDPTTSKKTPYGNAYWGFECSSIWELIPSTSPEHNLNRITLHCFKHNDYAWQPDIGLEIKYEDDAITYSLCQPPPRPETGAGHEKRVYDALDHPMSPSELSSVTSIARNVVSTTLARLAHDGLARNVSRGVWERGKAWPGEEEGL